VAGKNPFGDDDDLGQHQPDPAQVIRGAAARIGRLKGHVGHEGLSPAAARSLVEDVSRALHACADALGNSRDSDGGSL